MAIGMIFSTFVRPPREPFALMCRSPAILPSCAPEHLGQAARTRSTTVEGLLGIRLQLSLCVYNQPKQMDTRGSLGVGCDKAWRI
jgi:hypothetical protein